VFHFTPVGIQEIASVYHAGNLGSRERGFAGTRRQR
jgi:hypothetical protein